ncbi:MAG TPA: VWA domain-containing protein [Opitutaceae bacterium]|nr:VWA domain-containing protein [Opitutaceae bacterium]
MSFAWPQLFWLLLAPAALLAWDLTHRRRAAGVSHPKILQAEAGARSLTLSSFARATGPARQSTPRIWLCLGLAAAVVALTRPQWGRLEEPVFDQSREILLAVDLSRSMLVTDVRPSRLERTKLLIQSLLEKLAGERVGLIVFSGTAFLQSPLSADYEILREFMPALGPDFLPEGGTNYGPLLTTALDAFSSSSSADRFLIVMSDGEATDDDWKSKAEELKKKGIRVISLGVGTAAGAMIPDGGGGFVKDERGAVVLSKLEAGTLRSLAQSTGGTYRDASAWIDLAGLVQETIAAGRKGKFVEKNTVRLVERFQWPLAFALWCLLVSFYYEFPVRPRVRDLKAKNARAATTAALLLILISVLGSPVSSYAAATMAAPGSAKSGAPTPPPEPSALGKIVGRLAAAPKPTARDWADLGKETVTWGTRLNSEQHPVPDGPVRDALAAVDLGAKLDAKATDWPKLRGELEELLKKPEDQQQQDKNQQDQDKNQDQQNQDQQKQDPAQKDQQKSGQPQDQKDNQQKQDPAQDQNSKQEEKKQQGESAFGDMKQKQDTPPPPPPGNDTQKVGGAEKEEAAKEPVDPALALPLQKLDQLRNQDSPAHLFQLMEGERKPAKKPGKDW